MLSRRYLNRDSRGLFAILDRILISDLVVIDGGSKGGTRELVRLAKYISAYGFEPNASEYDKVVQNLSGSGGPAYKKITYLPFALMEDSGETMLYVTKRPGATSTLRPNAELLDHFQRDNWSQMKEVVAQEVVQGISLRDFVINEHLAYIDYIKLDTQGNELYILKSAGEFLQRISVVKTEVQLIPLYTGQPLVGNVCSFLDSQGFQLIDLQWTDACRRYHFSADLPRESYRLVWADAIFAYDPLNVSKPRTLEQAMILVELGYVDLGLYIISRLPSLAEADRDMLLRFYRERPVTPERSWLRRLLKRYLPETWLQAYRVLKQGKVSKVVPRVP